MDGGTSTPTATTHSQPLMSPSLTHVCASMQYALSRTHPRTVPGARRQHLHALLGDQLRAIRRKERKRERERRVRTLLKRLYIHNDQTKHGRIATGLCVPQVTRWLIGYFTSAEPKEALPHTAHANRPVGLLCPDQSTEGTPALLPVPPATLDGRGYKYTDQRNNHTPDDEPTLPHATRDSHIGECHTHRHTQSPGAHHRVLELRRALAVDGDRGPVVRPRAVLPRALVDHGLDREDLRTRAHR